MKKSIEVLDTYLIIDNQEMLIGEMHTFTLDERITFYALIRIVGKGVDIREGFEFKYYLTPGIEGRLQDILNSSELIDKGKPFPKLRKE